jgi:hypothetical protein
MTAAPRIASLLKLHIRDIFYCAEPVLSEVRPVTSGKKWVRAPEVQSGVGVWTLIQRLQVIMSGRAIVQQGLAATCKDLSTTLNRRRQEDYSLAHEFVRAMKVK